MIPITAADVEDTEWVMFVFRSEDRVGRIVGASFVCAGTLPAGSDGVRFALNSTTIEAPIVETELLAWTSTEGVDGGVMVEIDVGENGIAYPAARVVTLIVTKYGNGVILPPTTVFLKFLPDLPS